MSTGARVTSLTAEGQALLDEARQAGSGRAARTFVSGPVQRATLIALAKGSSLHEHDSPPAATFHVLAGQARLHSGENAEWVVGAGELVPVPPTRHAVDALEDCVILLTVALR